MKILVISDVDGCLTDGGMYYDSTGKVMKRFSAGDHEGLKLLKKNNIDVIFITADKVGEPITRQRLKDMSNSELHVISEKERPNFIQKYRDNYDYIIFFGDGLGDAQIKRKNICDMFVCPNQSISLVKSCADIITANEGGHAAFLEMSISVLYKLLDKKLINNVEELYE